MKDLRLIFFTQIPFNPTLKNPPSSLKETPFLTTNRQTPNVRQFSF